MRKTSKKSPKKEIKVVVGMPSTNTRKLYLREWAKANKDKVLLAQRKYRENNKEKRHISYKTWYYKNRENILAKRKTPHSKEVHKRSKERYMNTVKGRFYAFCYSNMLRNISVEIGILDYEEITSRPCYYCGETVKKRGIDRVDNNVCYVKENCTSCCIRCNMMKREMSVKDFLAHIETILNNLNPI